MNDIAKHLTPFLEYSPSRVPFLGLLLIGLLIVLLGSPNPEVVNSNPLQHSLSHIGFLIQVSLGNRIGYTTMWPPNQTIHTLSSSLLHNPGVLAFRYYGGV